jgi:hypothetical protein
MSKREPTTDELRRAQQERTTEEHEAIDTSITPYEEQHTNVEPTSPRTWSACWPSGSARSAATRTESTGTPRRVAMICV